MKYIVTMLMQYRADLIFHYVVWFLKTYLFSPLVELDSHAHLLYEYIHNISEIHRMTKNL